MLNEDFFYPFLASYIDSPQWIKQSVGRAYSMVAPWLKGEKYHHFLAQAALSDERELRQLVSLKLATSLKWGIETIAAYKSYHPLLQELATPEQVLRQLPLVSKEDYKNDLSRYLAAGMPMKLRLPTFTGGSTAEPMLFHLQKGVTRAKEYAFIENFQRRVGLQAKDISLTLRGRRVPTAQRPNGPLWMYEPIKRQLILSTDHLQQSNMPEYVKAIRAWQPRFIQAYPSAIYPLAHWLQENPAPDIAQRIKGILLYSENVLEPHLTLLQQVFSCPVLKHYGHSERVLMAASMIDDDRYFFWPQYGYVELVDEAGQPITRPGVLGEIVGTSFDNQVMPFLRYRTGDMAVLGDQPHPALPGYPVMERIEGRLQEFIVCRNRRLVSLTSLSAGHSSALAVAGIQMMQFEQTVPGHVVLKVIATDRLSASAQQRIMRAMEHKLQGDCTVAVVQANELPRTARGKQPMLVQHLDIRSYLPSFATA